MRYVITGGGSGIGRAVSLLAASDSPPGDKVSIAVVDRDTEAVESVRADLAELGADCVGIVADLADPDAPASAIAEAIAGLGGIDSLVSNAGIMTRSDLKTLDLETYERTFAINTRATWLLAQAAFPALRESRGSIVATTSISAGNPTPTIGVYSATKAALRVLIQQMALEWGRHGIRANCVSPGPTDTNLTKSSFGQTEDEAARASRAYREATTPLRRIARPEDLAQAIIFLAGPRAAHITGVELPVDGGISTALMPLAGGTPGYRPDDMETWAANRS